VKFLVAWQKERQREWRRAVASIATSGLLEIAQVGCAGKSLPCSGPADDSRIGCWCCTVVARISSKPLSFETVTEDFKSTPGSLLPSCHRVLILTIAIQMH
jgi:hypothetical protein